MSDSDNCGESGSDRVELLRSRRGILLVDVETTGLPKQGDFSTCRLVQIAMLLCDAVTKAYRNCCFLSIKLITDNCLWIEVLVVIVEMIEGIRSDVTVS